MLGAKSDAGAMVCREFTSAADARAWIVEMQAQRANIYFQPNDCRLGPHGKPRKEDVLRAVCLQVDIDPKPGLPIDEAQAAIQKRIDEFGDAAPPPTVDIASGGGRQLLWRLAEPVEFADGIAGEEQRHEFERYSQHLAKVFGGDKCHAVNHLMRLPGTINFPTKDKCEKNPGRGDALAHVIEADWDRVYPLSAFVKMKVRGGDDAHEQGRQGGAGGAVNLGNVRRIAPEQLLETLAPTASKTATA